MADEPQQQGARKPEDRDLEASAGLERREMVRGTRPGTRYIRRQLGTEQFTRESEGMLRARPRATEPRGRWGRFVRGFKRVLIGRPLRTEDLPHERLNKFRALAVFSSDAISSVAYASEEILIVLVLAGVAAVHLVIPISIAIVILLSVVALSYRQTIRAYPNGGGSYIVAHENLGKLPGLTAASALMTDYVLTVAVSISAGVAAITSAFAPLHPYRVELALAAAAFMVVANLRGVRESGTIFSLPTYAFIVGMAALIATGIVKTLLHGEIPFQGGQPELPLKATTSLSLFFILRAFAGGSSALTGVEAISNGVPAFKSPESRNARTTLTWMAIILGTSLLGVSTLAYHYGVVPNESQTVVSQIAQHVFGRGFFFYYIQFTTFMILVLAANTSFADFPRLSSILAHDRFMPHQFAFRGDRLAFSNGILMLGGLAMGLIFAFQASVTRLIPLYAIGVFVAFTLSQAGMVIHWTRNKTERGSRHSRVINGFGACLTAIVAAVFVVTKFQHGAWFILILIPVIVVFFWSVERHYRHIESELHVSEAELEALSRAPVPLQRIVVPVPGVNRAVLKTLRYARSLVSDETKRITAVHVTDDIEAGVTLRKDWVRFQPDIRLVILHSPFRAFTQPLLAYLDDLERLEPGTTVTVMLPEFVPEHWYGHILHNQTALRLKGSLLFRPNTVVIDVPYHIGRDTWAQRRSPFSAESTADFVAGQGTASDAEPGTPPARPAEEPSGGG